MDYQYFNTASQPYNFLGLPPTPSHTNSGASDEFSNGSPDAYDQFQNFDGFPPYSSATAPTHPAKPPTPLLQESTSSSKTSIPDFPNLDSTSNGSDANRAASNSDDDLTPAQSRRKAQNRAAQRAFRERKERHVKDLEAKIAAMEQSSQSMSAENERLKRDLQKFATENEILKATSIQNSRNSPSHHQSTAPDHLPATPGPMQYSPTDFYSDLLYAHDNKTPSHRIVHSHETGERLLAAGATWDFIIAHPLYKSGMVDVGAVSEKLKHLAKCDGQGPVFEEKDIINAIEKSIASGNDELL